MLHDFLITERFCIIPDLPLEYDPKGGVKNQRFMFDFKKDRPCQYLVFSRDAKDSSQIKTFKTDSHYVFHFANAWDTKNEK